jgi:Cu-Zn family superoxide dismutase
VRWTKGERLMPRSVVRAAVAVVAIGVLAACSHDVVKLDEHVEPPGAGAAAVTYDRDSVPVGSRIGVVEHRLPNGTAVALWVEGLRPDHTYGAHVHRKPCGARPDDSGPHYQNVVDPRQPSTNPAYANPRNEVWLDITTDEHGNAGSSTLARWRFRPGQARSVVVHEHATATRPGHAGMAGNRLACVNVPFQ